IKVVGTTSGDIIINKNRTIILEEPTTEIQFIQDVTTRLPPTAQIQDNTTPRLYKMPKFLVIIIQIHLRLNYLKDLVDSLRDVKYIESTLVIFSHDVYDEEMNEFINSIDFCAVS